MISLVWDIEKAREQTKPSKNKPVDTDHRAKVTKKRREKGLRGAGIQWTVLEGYWVVVGVW